MHPEVITSLYEEAKKRADWLEGGLKLIATASNQHNPIYLRKIAKSYLSNQYNTIQEEHKHRPLPAQFGGDTGVDADHKYNDEEDIELGASIVKSNDEVSGVFMIGSEIKQVDYIDDNEIKT